VQPPSGYPPLDLARAEAHREELSSGDRAMLLPHQRPDRRISFALIPRLVI
jgi:hypothetical protein